MVPYWMCCFVRGCPFSCTSLASYKVTNGELQAGGNSICFTVSLTGVLLYDLQKATLVTVISLRTLSRFISYISYRRLAPKFQRPLSALTLGIYLGGFSIQSWAAVKLSRASEPLYREVIIECRKEGKTLLSREKGRGAIDLHTGSYISLVLLGREEGAK